MNFEWEEIGKMISGILSVNGYKNIQMWDEDGTKTMSPEEAIRFIASRPSKDPELQSFDVMLIIHDENAASHLDIETPKLTNSQDFNAVYALKQNIQKNVGDRYGLKINWSTLGHNIVSKDTDDSSITESKDISRVYGTTKSSFQRVGESKLIIRHTDPVDENKQGSRWRKIKGIFIETKIGERFSYPYPHIAGARAMARHLSNNGSFVDQIAESIKTMSSDYVNLKRANINLKKNDMLKESEMVKESINMINKQVKSMSGPRGYSKMLESTPTSQSIDMSVETENLAKKLAEACNCVEDSEREPLNVAAKHIVSRMFEKREQLESRLLHLQKKMKHKATESLDRYTLNIVSEAHELRNKIEQISKDINTLGDCSPIFESLSRLKELGGIS